MEDLHVTKEVATIIIESVIDDDPHIEEFGKALGLSRIEVLRVLSHAFCNNFHSTIAQMRDDGKSEDEIWNDYIFLETDSQKFILCGAAKYKRRFPDREFYELYEMTGQVIKNVSGDLILNNAY
jgi:hypothetical protein